MNHPDEVRVLDHGFVVLVETLVEWAEIHGRRADTVGDRLDRGWSVELALEERIHPRRPNGIALAEGKVRARDRRAA